MSTQLPLQQPVSQALGKVQPYDTIMMILGAVIIAIGLWKPKFKHYQFLGIALLVFGGFLKWGRKVPVVGQYAP